MQIYNEGQYQKLCQYSKKNKRYELKCLIIILFKQGDNGAFYIVVMLTQESS